MYIVIVCVNCNGSVQVEEQELGKVVQCPLCGKPTVARTQTAVLPVAKPIESPPPPIQNAPFSLDDALPLPSPVKTTSPAVEPEREVQIKPPTMPRAKRSPVRTAVYVTVSLLFTLALMAGVYGAFRYGNGRIPAEDWKPFAPPDGKCTIQMPGEPVAEDIPAEGFAVLGGKRFTVKRWFENVEVSFGWVDYDANVAGQGFGQFVSPLRDREVKRLGGKLLGESEVKYTVKEGDSKREMAVRFANIDLEKGKAFLQIYFDPDPERLRYQIRTEMMPKLFFIYSPLFATGLPIEIPQPTRRREIEPGQRIRLWFATAQGKKITSDTKWLSKFFTSFAPE